MNLQNHIKIVFINIKPIYFCIPDMLIIWQLFSFLDEQTNTIPFHTKHLYIYTWCELKKDHVTYKYPIMIQQILDVIVEIWDMVILVQNFSIFSQTRRFMIASVKNIHHHCNKNNNIFILLMIYIKKYYLLYNIYLLFYSKTRVFSFDIVKHMWLLCAPDRWM